MKFERGHLLKPASERCSQFTNHSPAGTLLLILRQEASSSITVKPAAVWRNRRGQSSSILGWGWWGALLWWLFTGLWEYSMIRLGRCWDWTDVILAEASPSSQSCGLVRVWGGGWEGPLTATPPCLPAPRRSRSPGRGSEDRAEEVRVSSFKETTHAFWIRNCRLTSCSNHIFLMTVWLFSVLNHMSDKNNFSLSQVEICQIIQMKDQQDALLLTFV